MKDKIIDVHLHRDFSNEMIQRGARNSGITHSELGLQKELKSNNVVHIITIQTFLAKEDGTPITSFNPPLHVKKFKDNYSILAAINPTIKNDMSAYEDLIKAKQIMGFKIYLGYTHFYPYDPVYKPFYELAKKYNLVIMFHTGDNFSPTAKVKYAHPLNIDEVAVDYPTVKFIIAHLGQPWLYDAAEVVYKNANVYADLSGLTVGDLKTADSISVARIQDALAYCGYDRILYGSDWPLVPMDKYISLIKRIVPKSEWNKVFYENAKKLFDIKE